jgi:iron complex outermembrane receptor protein
MKLTKFVATLAAQAVILGLLASPAPAQQANSAGAGKEPGQPTPSSPATKNAANETASQNLPTITVYGLADQTPASPVSTRYGTQYNVVTDEQIKLQNSLDFLDALRNVPGVMYRKSNMFGTSTSADIFIRGRGASHPGADLAIYFDGVPRNGMVYGQSMANGLPVYAIGGMEIYKSPQPSRFGSGYGLVNIVPKYMAEEGKEFRLGFQSGSYGTVVENTAFGLKEGGFDIYAAQSGIFSSGYGDHADYRQENYYLNLGLKASENWGFRFLANHVDAEALNQNYNKERNVATESYDTKTTFLTLTVENQYEQAHGYVKFYYNDTVFTMPKDTNGVNWGNPAYYSVQPARATGLRARETVSPWEGGEIVVGFDLDNLHAANEDHNGPATVIAAFPDQTMFSPYVAVSQYFGAEDAFHITPSAGFRYYRTDVFADKLSPQAGLVLGYDQTDLNISYARGVNYPSPVVMQGFFYSGNGTGGLIPPGFDTASIRPEVVDHYEIGLTHTWPALATLGATYFYDDGRDRLRAFMGGPFNTSPAIFNYAATYKIKGFELSGALTPLENLKLFSGAAWMQTKATGENGKEVDRLPYSPDFSLSAGFEWGFLENFTLSGDYQHLQGLYAGTVGRSNNFTAPAETSKLDDINLVNLRLGYKFDYETWRLSEAEVFVSVDNVFNAEYKYDLNYPMPGTTFMVGADFKFN